MAFDETYVTSPCVRLCTLDNEGVCLGCLRTLDEIKAWGSMPAEAKRDLLARLEGRRNQRTGAPPDLTRRG